MEVRLWTDLEQLNTQSFNLPLMKISAYHKKQGDKVKWHIPLEPCDLLYCSKIFDNDWTLDLQSHTADKVIKGGVGYDLKNSLPFDIEHIYPDYSLYPFLNDTAVGFITRGCPCKCTFCNVAESQGSKSIQVAELSEFYYKQNNITLFDPNILACKDREKILIQLAETKATVRFEQGLDASLITSDVIDLLKKIKIDTFYLALDRQQTAEAKKKGMLLLRQAYPNKNYSKFTVYMLVNYDTTWEYDLERVSWLKDNGFDPYVMVFNKSKAEEKYKHLQRAVNNKFIFRSMQNVGEYKELKKYIKGGE